MPLREPRPRKAPHVSARIAALITLRLQACGVAPDRVFRTAGLPAPTFEDADARIPLGAEEKLWDAAAQATRDPLFGLHAAESIQPGRFDVLDYVVRTAPDLREALQRLARYNRLLHDVAGFTLIPLDGELRVEHGLGVPSHAAHPQAAEFTLASLVVVGRQLLPLLRVLHVEFVHARLGPIEEYERVFGVRPVFGRPTNAVGFPAEMMDVPIPAADAVLSRIVTAHAEQALAAMSPVHEPVVAHVRRIVAATLSEGPPSLQKVARALHMGDRTLQRRLQSEGVRFDDVVDQLRRELALRYTAGGSLALGEVAYLLGYSEPSPFHRAFKRWTGMTPAAYRSLPPR